MKLNVSQANDGITKNVDVSLKKFMYVKKIMFGTQLHVIVKYLASIMDDSVITYDEIVESYNEEIKTSNKF